MGENSPNLVTLPEILLIHCRLMEITSTFDYIFQAIWTWQVGTMTLAFCLALNFVALKSAWTRTATATMSSWRKWQSRLPNVSM
jgi:hypothetical protein